jgi:ribonuclease HI
MVALPPRHESLSAHYNIAMDTKDEFIIYTDGGARGNPGPAAWAFVLKRSGAPDLEKKGFLGDTTNNIAEYTALLKALESAQAEAGKRLVVYSDSELMVRQMLGVYKVKHPGLLPLYQQASKLVKSFEKVDFKHVRREQNQRADELVNEVLDGDRD